MEVGDFVFRKMAEAAASDFAHEADIAIVLLLSLLHQEAEFVERVAGPDRKIGRGPVRMAFKMRLVALGACNPREILPALARVRYVELAPLGELGNLRRLKRVNISDE
jgi:hypothetical protein